MRAAALFVLLTLLLAGCGRGAPLPREGATPTSSLEVSASTPQAPLPQDDLRDEAAEQYREGMAQIQAGDLPAALAAFDAALALRPTFAEALHQRGVTYAMLGQINAAISDYDQAIAAQPAMAAAYHDRGLAFLAREQFDRALADLDQAIALDPTFADAYFNRGNLHYLLGNQEAAISDFRQHLALAPATDATAQLELWVQSLEAGQPTP